MEVALKASSLSFSSMHFKIFNNTGTRQLHYELLTWNLTGPAGLRAKMVWIVHFPV